jgi:hypothetical protein
MWEIYGQSIYIYINISLKEKTAGGTDRDNARQTASTEDLKT